MCVGLAFASGQRSAQPWVPAGGQPPAPPTVSQSAVPAAAAGRPTAPPQAGSAHRASGPVLVTSAPLTLAIPAIGVRSPLPHLGQAPDGTIEAPAPGPRYDEAGWYRYSPAPGSLGPAIIVGHVDSAADGPSVFFRLGRLHRGDTVLVTRVNGSVAVFTVDAVGRYPKSRFPTALVYGNTDHAALRLITCGGPFDRSAGSYLDNVVVFASLVGHTPAVQFR